MDLEVGTWSAEEDNMIPVCANGFDGIYFVPATLLQRDSN